MTPTLWPTFRVCNDCARTFVGHFNRCVSCEEKRTMSEFYGDTCVTCYGGVHEQGEKECWQCRQARKHRTEQFKAPDHVCEGFHTCVACAKMWPCDGCKAGKQGVCEACRSLIARETETKNQAREKELGVSLAIAFVTQRLAYWRRYQAGIVRNEVLAELQPIARMLGIEK